MMRFQRSQKALRRFSQGVALGWYESTPSASSIGSALCTHCFRRRGHEPVFFQNRFQLLNIRWSARIYNSRGFPEEVRAEQRRSHHRQRFGIRLSKVIEAMDCSARDKMRFTWADIHGFSIHGEVITPCMP